MKNRKSIITQFVKSLTEVLVVWQSIVAIQEAHAQAEARKRQYRDDILFWEIINSNHMV